LIRLSILVALVFSALAMAARADLAVPVVPRFEDVTASSGLSSTYSGEYFFMVGGGVATFDCDADGYPDVFTAGGENVASLYRNTSQRGGALTFKKQISGLEFEKVSGAYPLDIDADGNTDLVLLRVGENKVMRGLGGCQFEDANKRWNFDGGKAWSVSFAATFENGASWPTLAVGNYINPEEELSPWGSCTENWLHRGAAQAFAKPLPLTPSYCALSMLFTDWDRSGTPSLRVSNDREYYEGGEEQMWKLLPDQAPVLYAEKDGWQRLRIWGMGIASRDLNGDSYPDFYLTSMGDNKLQFLKQVPTSGKPKPIYKDSAWPAGVTAHRPFMGDDLRNSTAWHAQFEDVNNDTLADLFVAKGNVAKMPDFAAEDPNNLLLGKVDSTFIEAADKAGVASMENSRGGMVVDFNLDGLLDLIVVNREVPAQIWRNTSKSLGKWLQLKLEQPGANGDGIGAWIEVKSGDATMRREITSGGGHASGHLGWWHFGLGAADKAEVRVLWPDGVVGPWQTIAANGFYRLTRDNAPMAWQP
jgi:enediyne biosynthesis protein E4